MIKRAHIFNYLFTLIILLPVVFSFLFRVTGLPVPTYLFIMLISVGVVFLTINSLLTISISWFKFIFFIFFIWILSSILYSPSVIASKIKFIDIIYNTISPIVVIELFFLSSNQKTIEFNSFNKYILLTSKFLLWFSIVAFAIFRQPEVSGRYTIPGVDNSIWFSRFIGMLVLIILCQSKVNNKNIWGYLLSIFIGVLLLFAGGSRGPVLSVLIVFFIKQSYLVSKKKLFLLLFLITLFLVIGYLFIGGYLFETDFYSIYARFDLFSYFLDSDLKLIKGSGIGSFSLLTMGEDVTYYPHNIFLEIFFENGLIGLILFLIILFLFFKSFKLNIVYLLCIYFLIASLVSGDIPGNNNFFILLFISIYAKNSIDFKNDFSNIKC